MAGLGTTGARIFDGFKNVYSSKFATNELEVASGILKRDITNLNKKGGMGKAVAEDMRNAASISNIELDKTLLKTVKKGNLDQAEGIATGSTADILARSRTNMQVKLDDLESMAGDPGLAAAIYKTQKDGSLTDKIDYYAGATQAYFNTPGKRAARIGTAAGVYAAGALGVRGLAGGSATRNSSGERDIAGIPFI